MSFDEVLWKVSWNNIRLLTYSYNDNNRVANNNDKEDLKGMDISEFGKMLNKR